MANFRIVILPAKRLKDGGHKLRIAVSHNGETRYIPTRYKVENERNLRDGRVVGTENDSYYNARLNELLQSYERAYDRTPNAPYYSCSDLLTVMKSKMVSKLLTVEALVAEYTERFDLTGKFRSKKSYYVTLRSMERYKGSKEILLEEIDPKFVLRYATYLHNGGVSNATISCYMSYFRSLLNYAKKMRYIKYEVEPFEMFKMPAYCPRESSLDIDEVRRLIAFVPQEFYMGAARDIWLLSFFLGGMNLEDIMKVNFNGITELSYERAKTVNMKKGNKTTKFDIQPEAAAIIQRYKNNNGKLEFGKFKRKPRIVDMFARRQERLAAYCGIRHRFIYSSARKTFFQIGFELGESPDVLDYCSGHAASNRMAMHYIVIRPDMASAAMRRIFDSLKDGETACCQ